MKKPTFFISSTIYDFRDLRSALKFYLEEQGCTVLASEFNDFQKPLDTHSYEACLQAIRSADYFILLIGTRVGGWYDEDGQISITQREYREAYELHQAGKLKLLNFVRSDVWQAKEDRRELAKFLSTTGLDAEIRSSIANHPSKSASNADFLIKFINEVGRNNETSLAVKQKGPAPTGNWIHIFAGFRDVVDVLNAYVLSSIPIEAMTARRLLRRELRDILGQCLLKLDSTVLSPRYTIERFHEEHPITLKNRSDELTRISTKLWDLIASISLHLLRLRQINPVVLPQVLAKPTFLEFDLNSNSFRETPVQNGLVKLQHEIGRFNVANTTENLAVVFEHPPARRSTNAVTVRIETIKLASLLNVLDRWSNIVELCSSLLKYLDGAEFTPPMLRPDSPIQGMQEMIDAEKPSDRDIDTYLADN